MCEYMTTEDFIMDKYIYDENNDLWYELVGDHYLPCLDVPAEEKEPVGIWGQRRRRYLQEHREPLYTACFSAGNWTHTLRTWTGRRRNCFLSW